MKGLESPNGSGSGIAWNLEIQTLLAYLKEDPQTKVIGIFTEGSSDPRAFIREVAAITPEKPIIVYKGGMGDDADRVTVTHTGAAAGSERVWEGALRQAGAHLVTSVSEMIAVCKALSLAPVPSGRRIGIFTHTAGPSIVAWDILKKEPGCVLATLGAGTIERIAKILGP